MKMNMLFGATTALATAALAPQALAVINLTHTVGGTAASYSSTAAATTTNTNISDANFRADAAQADQVWDNAWFWRLAGDTREFQFSAVGAVDASAGNTGTRTYATLAGGAFSALINYTLTDGAVAGQALLSQTMTITNTSAQALSINLFNYLDGDVGPGAAGDSASLLGPGTMHIIEQTNPALFMDYQGVGATAFQSGVFGGVPGTLLTNTAVNDLNNGGLPSTNVDWAGAFQWTLEIAAGASASVTVNMAINSAIPAPGALALLGLAGLVGGRRRRA